MAGERYLVLARKWRPQTFEDVIGQEHITRTLQNAITSGRIGHAFLFIGSRGIGKTTTARILSKALNCSASDGPTARPCGECNNCVSIAAGNNIDVIEIDGASNNSVDNVREIREHIRMVPSGSRYKIYIIDEVHQLSTGAFNALLKTLEEPPPHAVFILATTEASKIPATIVSRCQRYDFRRVPLARIQELLRKILDAEKVTCSDDALHAIARSADGGMRDAESVLDQLLSYCGDTITFQDVFDVLGLVDWRVLHEMCDAVLTQDVAALLTIVEDIVASGKDLSQFVEDILRYFRNLLVCKTADAKKLLALPDDEIHAMQEHAKKFTLTALIRMVEQFAELSKDFDSQLAQRIALESLLIRLAKVSVEVSVDTVLEKLLLLGQSGVAEPARREGASGLGDAATVRQRTEAPKLVTAYITPPELDDDSAPESAQESAPTPTVRKRKSATAKNMAALWQQIKGIISQGGVNLNLGMNADRAKPVAVENGVLTLQVPSDQARAKAFLEKPEHRGAIESALAELTDNLHTFRIDLADIEDAEETLTPQGTLPVSGRVDVNAARAALEDPHVAQVMDIFKGRIVDIKSDSSKSLRSE